MHYEVKPLRPVCLVKEAGSRVPTSFLVFLFNPKLTCLVTATLSLAAVTVRPGLVPFSLSTNIKYLLHVRATENIKIHQFKKKKSLSPRSKANLAAEFTQSSVVG